jgi:hypothetical protein
VPYNLLLLPLLGGYILVTYSNCAIYWSSRQAKEQLLLASAVAGMLLALVARLIVMLTLAYAPLGKEVGLSIHAVLDLPGIGTASLSFFLGCAFAYWINRAWPMQESGLWLYGRGALTQLESLFMMSIHAARPVDSETFRPLPFEVLWRLGASVPWLGLALKRKMDTAELFLAVRPDSTEADLLGPIPLMLTMKDRKVYVGFLEKTPSLSAGAFTHISLVVLRSGYREKDTLRVSLTDDYSSVFSNTVSPLPPFKVLPVQDISSASLFDPAVFAAFSDNTTAASDSPRDEN